MNNDPDNRAYPCDENEAGRAYPCDEPVRDKTYPCDEAFYDASESGQSERYAAEERQESPLRKGKGKRGGNAAFSRVVHSGAAARFRSSGNRSENAGEPGENDVRRGRDDRFAGRRERFSEERGEDGFGRSTGRGFGKYDRYGSDRGGRYDRSERGARPGSDRSDRYGSDRSGRSNKSERNGKFDRNRYGSTERGKSPESLFSRAYNVEIDTVNDIGAFVKAPEDILKGAYASKISENRRILLPFAEQIGRPVSGDRVTVHFYEDKGGRLACTMRTPILKEGEVGILKVAAVTKIGAFLDNGVPKQVLLPFKEQIKTPEVGDEVLVWVYSDKSGRQAATMRVYGHLEKYSPYKEDDRVTGFIYEINPKLGIFVAVDNKYYGLVPINETFKNYEYGDEIEARVAKVRDDGKLDLLIRDKLYKTVQEDADVILYELRRNNGFLSYGDRADAEFIEETYAMSKNQFKRALGHLYKNHIVDLDREKDTVRLIK